MLPGRLLKLTPSWWAANLGSSSSSREIRDRVPVMVAGLQVFTSLKMTEEGRRKEKREREKTELERKEDTEAEVECTRPHRLTAQSKYEQKNRLKRI